MTLGKRKEKVTTNTVTESRFKAISHLAKGLTTMKEDSTTPNSNIKYCHLRSLSSQRKNTKDISKLISRQSSDCSFKITSSFERPVG